MFDFLAQVTIADVEESAVSRKSGPRKERNPQGLAIRVFRDGSIYPSQELVDTFSLEYAGKDVEHGYGFDVVDSKLYTLFQHLPKRMLFISPVKKSAGKVDIFGSVGYEETGVPKSSVMEQGSKTYGQSDLIPMLEEVYGLKLGKEEGELEFVDLVFLANPSNNQPWTLPAGRSVTHVPKKVSRGEAKGSVTTVRREEPKFYALVPLSFIEPKNETAAETAENEPVAEIEPAEG